MNAFWHHITKDRASRWYLIIALGGSMLLWTIYKMLYPFPHFSLDSYSYLFAASRDVGVNLYPIGYSQFLRVFHSLTHSSSLLTGLQYCALQGSFLYLFFTISFLHRPVNYVKAIIFVGLLFNPVSLLVSNAINNLSLFGAVTAVWLAETLWITYKPKPRQIYLHAVLLLAAFTLSYQACYFPIVSILAFAMSRQSRFFKITAGLACVSLIILFVMYSRNEASKLTGTAEFPLGVGWQIANNALYIYEYTADNLHFSPEEKWLDHEVKGFYRMAPADFRNSYLTHYAGDFFAQESLSPLQRFVWKRYSSDSLYCQEIASRARASVVFAGYGSKLIRHNLGAYFWEFIVPNMANYFYPPLGKLTDPGIPPDALNQLAVNWFSLSTPPTGRISPGPSILWQSGFRLACAVINCYLLLNFVLIVIGQGVKKASVRQKVGISIIGWYLCCAFVFNISTHLVVFSSVFISLPVSLLLSLLLTQWVDEDIIKKEMIRRLKFVRTRRATPLTNQTNP